jgi:hypothetical protein
MLATLQGGSDFESSDAAHHPMGSTIKWCWKKRINGAKCVVMSTTFSLEIR